MTALITALTAPFMIRMISASKRAVLPAFGRAERINRRETVMKTIMKGRKRRMSALSLHLTRTLCILSYHSRRCRMEQARHMVMEISTTPTSTSNHSFNLTIVKHIKCSSQQQERVTMSSTLTILIQVINGINSIWRISKLSKRSTACLRWSAL